MKEFFNAIWSYKEAFHLISKLNLWRYFFVSGLISLILAGIIITFSFSFSDELGVFFISFYPFEIGKEVMLRLSVFLGWLLILGLGLVVYKHLIMAVSAPFMTPLSEKIEAYLSKKPIHSQNNIKDFSASLSRSIRLNLRNLCIELLLVIPLSILSLIPVFGLIFYFLLLIIQSYYAGFGNMDYTLERHLSYKRSIQFVRSKRSSAIGNGLVYILLLFIPFFGILITLPLSTAAATVNTYKKLNQNNLLKYN